MRYDGERIIIFPGNSLFMCNKSDFFPNYIIKTFIFITNNHNKMVCSIIKRSLFPMNVFRGIPWKKMVEKASLINKYGNKLTYIDTERKNTFRNK